MPGMGENALLKMAPVLERLAARQPSYALTERAAAFLERHRRGPRRPGGVDRAPARGRPAPGDDVRADARRHVHADADHGLGEDQRDPQPRRAEGRLPRARRASARRRCARAIAEVLGDEARDGWRIEFTERIAGNRSPIDSPLMDAISAWIAEHDPGREVRARDPAGLHRLAPLPRGVPGVRRLRLLPAAPPVAVADRRR